MLEGSPDGESPVAEGPVKSIGKVPGDAIPDLPFGGNHDFDLILKKQLYLVVGSAAVQHHEFEVGSRAQQPGEPGRLGPSVLKKQLPAPGVSAKMKEDDAVFVIADVLRHLYAVGATPGRKEHFKVPGRPRLTLVLLPGFGNGIVFTFQKLEVLFLLVLGKIR